MSHDVLAPIRLRGLEVRNRIWVSPMCQYSAERQDGVATDWHLVHLGGMARGGAGAVLLEATGVLAEGRISPQDLGLWNDEQQEGLRRVVDVVHAQGAAAGIQLAHAGRKGSTYRPWGETRTGSVDVADGGWSTTAPSALAFPGLAVPRELDQAGIDRVVAGFAAAAGRAVAAGFDLLELHAAHGYLIHQFLSPLSNLREDGYGGSLAGRARLLLETVDAVRATIPDRVPVLVRLSATDWADGGLTIEDTVEVARLLAGRGVDLADLSSGGNVADAAIPVGPGYQVPFATAVRSATGLPVAAVGMIVEPAQAEQIVATGLADVVLVGREFLRDPNFPVRVAHALRVAAPHVPGQYLRAYPSRG